MPTRDAAPLGAPCWIELFSSDPDHAEQFYGELFGWTAEPTGPEYGGYVNFRLGDALVAGMMRNDGSAGTPDVWSTYLAVADAKATAEAAVAAGGQVLVEPMQVGPLGTMGLLADPGGAAIGMWQPGDAPRLRPVRGGRRAGLARAAHPRLRGHAGVLPDRVRLADRGHERHRRLPLHQRRDRRPALRRGDGRPRLPARGHAGQLADLPRLRRRGRARWPRWSGSAAPCCSPPRTPRTAGWPRSPTPPGPRSSVVRSS